MSEQTDQVVADVRAFNRFFTNQIGVLRGGHLGSPYTLTEVRVIFDLAQSDSTDVTDLRRTLDIDAGYLSRILSRFDADGLITRQRSETDGRRQVIGLTPTGRTAWLDLDKRSSVETGKLLAPLTDDDRARLVGAMATIRDLLDRTQGTRNTVVIRQPEPGDLGWVVQRHGALYTDSQGWDSSFEGMVAGIAADFLREHDAREERGWIAEVDGNRAGAVFCTRETAATARLRLLFVEPAARGLGLGSRLVTECMRFARRAGYQRMVLSTYSAMVEARRIYAREGFEVVEEEKVRRFGSDLVSETWSLDL